MDIIINLLFWIHLLALVAGGSSAVVGPIIGARLPGATPEVRLAHFAVLNQLSRVGRAAVATLLVTGPLMLWLKYGGFGGASPWFWVKMVFVAIMLAALIYGGINEKKAQAGDTVAAKNADMAHKATAAAFAAVVFSAVFAFN